MTSTVSAQTKASLPDIFRALFPCASITGAPKFRTMEIIRELETLPRAHLHGCIGLLRPGRSAQFNVAIRTVQIDRPQARALRYGTGGGIVWDSDRCGRISRMPDQGTGPSSPSPRLQLLETLRWNPDAGYGLLDHHLGRLADSAVYFGFDIDLRAIRQELEAAAAGFSDISMRVRLLVADGGDPVLQSTPGAPIQRDAPSRGARRDTCRCVRSVPLPQDHAPRRVRGRPKSQARLRRRGALGTRAARSPSRASLMSSYNSTDNGLRRLSSAGSCPGRPGPRCWSRAASPSVSSRSTN